MWKAALPSLLWAIWKERNKVVFDNDRFSPSRLKHSSIISLTSWAGIIYEAEYSIVSVEREGILLFSLIYKGDNIHIYILALGQKKENRVRV